MRRSRIAALVCGLSLLSASARAQEAAGWFALEVPGGEATLRALGVDVTRPRAAVMIDLIRRLHFSTQAPTNLQIAIKNISPQGASVVTLPLPLAPAVWAKQILGRAVPPARLFQEILSDPSARLLYQGDAEVDRGTA
jgi:hypothetical protein